MLDFLRMLAPHHTDALRPASALRRPAVSGVAPSDVRPSWVDEASSNSPSLAAPSLSDAAPAAMVEHAMPTASERLAPLQAPRMTLSSADVETGAPLRTSAMPTTEPPTPRRHRARTIELSTASALPATTRRRPPDPLTAETHFQPAGMSPSNRSEPLPERADRPARRNYAAAASLPPLSPSTVALYATPSSERDTAPAIHVTIDRIEVRAPATASRPAPGKRREPAQAQSLGDYLRGSSKVTQ